MVELKKTIKINDERVLKYYISDTNTTPTYTIMEGFIEDDEVQKIYYLKQLDNYSFTGWINNTNKDIDRVSFEFDINHPLYIPLLHLLNYNEELIIEDDSIKEKNSKYTRIHRIDNKIQIDFIDKKYGTDLKTFTERFHISNKGTIELFNFFNEVNEVLMSDYKQITIEEYLLKNNKEEECKKVFIKQKIIY